MNRVVEILMKRDGVTAQEAREMVRECRQEMFDLIEDGEYSEAEEVIEWMLGLEPDYIMDIL